MIIMKICTNKNHLSKACKAYLRPTQNNEPHAIRALKAIKAYKAFLHVRANILFYPSLLYYFFSFSRVYRYPLYALLALTPRYSWPPLIHTGLKHALTALYLVHFVCFLLIFNLFIKNQSNKKPVKEKKGDGSQKLGGCL